MKHRGFVSSEAILFVTISFLIIIFTIHTYAKSTVKKGTNSRMAAPTVEFAIDNNNSCSGEIVSFTSSASGVGVLNYNWSFGDGETSTLPNPTHIFRALGCGLDATFPVSLTVTDDNGTTTVSHIVTVKRRPNINFYDVNAGFGNPFENCNIGGADYDLTVGLDPNSDVCVTSYSVDWGDGNMDSNVTFPFTYTYVSEGTFEMIITGIGQNGCSSERTIIVSNSSNPKGGIVTPGGTVFLCLPASPLLFTISNWGSNPPETVYNVDYGDGTIITVNQNQMEASTYYNASDPAASSNYPIPHTYTVTNCPNPDYYVSLNIVTACGVSNLTAGPISVYQKPEVSFAIPDVGCVNTPASIINTSDFGFTLNCETTVAWFWDMGDGTRYTDFEPVHSYTAPGTYTISLYAQNHCGVTETITHEICIETPLTPEFTISNTEGCFPFNTTLQNTTTIENACSDATFEWVINYIPDFCGTENGANIINGTDATSTTAEIEFTSSGRYEITLEGTNACGTISSIAQEVLVKAPPEVVIEPIGSLCGLDTVIAPRSIISSCSTEAITYNWSLDMGVSPTDWEFINGTNLNSEFPEIIFYTHNNYILSLEVTNNCGVTIDTEDILFSEVPTITNTDIDQELCSGTLTEEIVFTSDDPNTIYTWTGTSPTNNISGVIATGTSNSIPSHLLSLDNGTSGTVIYTVVPYLAPDCPGDSFEIVTTVTSSIAVDVFVTNNTCVGLDDASIEVAVSGGIPFPGSSSYSVRWTGPNDFTSTDENIFNLGAGDYELEIRDDGGCIYSEIITITEPEGLAFSSILFDPETISCFGVEDGTIDIIVEGGTLPYLYSWTKNGLPYSTDEALSDLGPGTYEVTVTDANNCGPITQSFTIEEPALLEISLEAQTNILCFGEATGALEINITGGQPAYSFSWTGPNGFVSTDQNIYNLIAGTYTVLVTDRSGCVSTHDFTLIENTEITLDVSVIEVACYGDNDGEIVINNISGGVAPYTIAWSNFGLGMEQTNLSPGIYTITVTDSLSCSKSFTYEIEEVPIFLIDPEVTQISCSGENNGRIVLNFEGGVPPITLVWDDDASVGVERNNLGPGTYTVTITDAVPCVITQSFTIYNPAPLELSAVVTDALDCTNANSGAIDLFISGGSAPYQVEWSNGATTEDLQNIPRNTYHVTVTDANGCQVEGSWQVNGFAPLMVEAQDHSEIDCDVGSVLRTFTAVASGGVPPYRFNWSSGVVSGSNDQIMTTDTSGLVVLEVTDSLGCNAAYSFDIEPIHLGYADFEVSSFGYLNHGIFAILDPIQFTNIAPGDFVNILWDFDDGSFSNEENPLHIYQQVGTYIVTQTITNPFGCVYTHTMTLVVEKGYRLIMPNAFTPNADGVNDFFGPQYIGLKNLELRVYDTWGSLVYSESGDTIRGWNGKIKNQEAENGNYYYIFRAQTFYDEMIEEKGAFVYIK